MIKVQCIVKTYEMNGKETSLGAEGPNVQVESHWNRDQMVAVRFGDGHWFTVVARDLITALENATRTAK